jgi:uncharacterized repeat protein (TIGR03803 family)
MNPNLGTTISQKISRIAAVVVAVILFTTLAATRPAIAQTETVLYSFCSANCDNGELPTGNLITDSSGNLYGTAAPGEGYNNGAVYKASFAGAVSPIYAWATTATNLGNDPSGGVVMDSAGNFYGTTQTGGTNANGGTVFKISPEGVLTVLYNFCSLPSCTDGQLPLAGVILDASGNLYGTTYDGGTNANGTVYKITQDGTETVLYNFGASANDAEYPQAGLVMDKNGNLYGTTTYGGLHTGIESAGNGTVFEVSASGVYSILYDFGAKGKTDGLNPIAGLTLNAKGHLYGTTSYGGANAHGTIFELSPGASAWKETILYSFVQSNGSIPMAGVTLDSKGNIYATGSEGGSGNWGSVIELSRSGTATVLYSFTGMPDAGGPESNVVLDSAGNLYGVTSSGGAAGRGAVYKITR